MAHGGAPVACLSQIFQISNMLPNPVQAPDVAAPPGARVRVATLADAAAIADIYAPFVRDSVVSFELEPPSAEQMRERIAATLPTLPWLVSEDAHGTVSGYVYASRHRERAAYQWAVDTTVYIRPDSQGRGLGRQLYTRLKAILAELGYFQAFAGIALPNEASVALHEAMGFKPIGIYRDVGFRRGQWLDVGRWQCRLRPSSSENPSPPLAFDAWSRVEDSARFFE